MWLVLVAWVAQSPDFQADGLKALDARKYDTAVELLTKAIAADPKDYGARFNLALAYSFLGKDAEAIPQYKAVLELKPGLYEAELNLGVSLIRSKDAAGAVPYLKPATEQKPKEYRPVFYLGEALLQTGRVSEAESAYTTALSIKPESAEAESGLGRALARQDRIADAEPHFRKAAALDPRYKDSLLELASLYEASHRSAEAIAIYRDFPENPGAQERMGALLLDAGQASSAIPSLEAAVARSPTVANRVALAQAYEKSNQAEKAAPLVAQAVASAPRDLELRMFYGRMLRDQHKYADAATQFFAATQLKPDSVPAWNELSAVLVISEQWPQAIAALDRVRALGAEGSGQLFFRAIAFDHLHQIKDALANYNKFLEVSQGKSPDEEFKARQRVKIIEHQLGKR